MFRLPWAKSVEERLSRLEAREKRIMAQIDDLNAAIASVSGKVDMLVAKAQSDTMDLTAPLNAVNAIGAKVDAALGTVAPASGDATGA